MNLDLLPAGTYQATWFFESGRYGWSESLFTPAGDHRAALDKAKLYANLRKELLYSGAELSAARVSDVHQPGDANLHYFSPPSGNLQSALQDADAPWSAYLIRCQNAANTAHRNMFLSGIEDNQVGGSADKGRGNTKKVLDTAMRSWISSPNGGLVTWSWVGVDKAQPFAPLKPLGPAQEFVKLSVGGGLAELFIGPHAIVAGDFVLVSGVKDVKNLKGRFKVVHVDSNSILVRPKDGRAFTGTHNGGGKVRKESPILIPIANAQIVRAVKKSRGRPFVQPRGRRKSAV